MLPFLPSSSSCRCRRLKVNTNSTLLTVLHLGLYTFPIIQRLVEQVVTVTDAQLIETMRFFAQRMKIVAEPTGCLAAAAVMSGIVPVAGKRVGVLISGGNVDLARLAQFLG
ncbi:MAG: pyridoxal-phosphate dependent enzyme [Paraburkholderia sp.]